VLSDQYCTVLGSTWTLLYSVYSDSLDTPQIEGAQTVNCDICQNLGESEVPAAFAELQTWDDQWIKRHQIQLRDSCNNGPSLQ
jgi:hypothetical protein